MAEQICLTNLNWYESDNVEADSNQLFLRFLSLGLRMRFGQRTL